jgi:hypothetical protein
MSPLERAIERTLIYFEQFDCPLSLFELWKWLLLPDRVYTLEEVNEVLSERPSADGFYGIGIESVIKRQLVQRHDRHRDAVHKHRIALRVARILARLPTVQGIAVCNSLAWHNTTPKSDIDLFIVTAENSVWRTRLWTAGPLRLLGMRPGDREENPVCLSFFVDEMHVDMERYAIAPYDPYLAYWCASLSPLYDANGWTKAFAQNNIWIKRYLPNASFARRAAAYRIAPLQKLPWLPVSESMARSFQERHFPSSITTQMNVNSNVVVNDHVLKFHTIDRRADFAYAIKDMF